MSDTLRDELIKKVGYRFGALVSGNNQPDMSGDPRARIHGTRRRWFDDACAEVVDEIIAAIPAPAQAPASAENIARTICLSYGRDPDEQTSMLEMCDADNRPVATWRVYEEQAEAILAAYSVSSRSPTPARLRTPA